MITSASGTWHVVDEESTTHEWSRILSIVIRRAGSTSNIALIKFDKLSLKLDGIVNDPVTARAMISSLVAPPKGRRPEHQAYNTTPMLHTSISGPS